MKRLLSFLARWLDNERTARYLRTDDTMNQSPKLLAIYQAMDDMDDSLTGIAKAIAQGDSEEALTMIHLARASIADHITELRELL
jgi:hypothetical protein